MGNSPAAPARSYDERTAARLPRLWRAVDVWKNDPFGGRHRAIRRAADRVATTLAGVDLRTGLRGTFAVAADCLVKELHARRVVLAVRDVTTSNVFLWRGGRLAGAEAEPVTVARVPSNEHACYFAGASAQTWSAVDEPDAGWHVVTIDRGEMSAADASMRLCVARVATAVGATTHLLVFAVGRPGEWEGRLFVVDADVPRNRIAGLAAARDLIDRTVAAMDNAYLLHRIRVRSAANERLRIARALHDGLIQSVMAVQIQLHALSARLSSRSHPLAHDLTRLAAVLRDEALGLREMMQGMQPAELEPDRLVETIAGTVRRFQHETGIRASFIANVDRVPLPPRACRELAHVVQEALINVRKHSGASQVKVALTHERGTCLLSIDDDGAGFPFSGRLTPKDSAYETIGPRVIGERVRRIGGDLSVVSAQRRGTAPSGARLTISIPLNDYAIAG